MEPMTLGSPSGSPAIPYLPSYLMGEQTAPSTPRSNTLSPTKRSLSFAQSPGPTTPTDFNRSNAGQKTLFGYQQTPPTANCSTYNTYSGTPNQHHNVSLSGPPTQGLFDSLTLEKNQVHTPVKHLIQNNNHIGSPALCSIYQQNQSMNDSYLNSSNFNSRITSPVSNLNDSNYRTTQQSQQQSLTRKCADFWVTVYGYPPNATSMILLHFAQCGTIIDKVFPAQNGNWVHLKFSSRLEADRALNYNEKILGNNIMIGVTHCKDSNIIDKENLCESYQASRVRPLSQVAYNSAQNESAVVTSPNAPQRSSGIVNKAMDLLFGW